MTNFVINYVYIYKKKISIYYEFSAIRDNFSPYKFYIFITDILGVTALVNFWPFIFIFYFYNLFTSNVG